jgi:hypothetical protein
MYIPKLFPSLLFSMATLLPGADYYLDNVNGNNQNSGFKDAPVATFNALKGKLKPGDTVHLNPTNKIYRQTFVMRRSGTEDNPITINGNGQVVSGSNPIESSRWESLGNGVYKAEGIQAKLGLIVNSKFIYEKLDRDAVLPGQWSYFSPWKRLYYLPRKGEDVKQLQVSVTYDGGKTLTFTGRDLVRSHSKAGALRYKKSLVNPEKVVINGKEIVYARAIDSLKPGEWAQYNQAIYFKPAAAFDIKKDSAEAVVRDNGFGIYCGYAKIHDVTVMHVSNDGYNIHGKGKGIVLDRCHAISCGDEGVSAHGTCEISYTNSIIRECENGINNIMDSRSQTKNIIISDCWGNGIEFKNGKNSNHSVENAVLVNNNIPIKTSKGSSNTPVKLTNMLIVNESGKLSNIVLEGGKNVLSNAVVYAPKIRVRLNDGTTELADCKFMASQVEFRSRAASIDSLTTSGVEVPEATSLFVRNKKVGSFLQTGQKGIKPLSVQPSTSSALGATSPALKTAFENNSFPK